MFRKRFLDTVTRGVRLSVVKPCNKEKSLGKNTLPLFIRLRHSSRDGYRRFDRQTPDHVVGVRLLVTGVVATGSFFVWVTHRQEIPYTKRKHFVILDVDDEKNMGKRMFEALKKEAQAKKSLLPDTHPATRMVKSVGHRIIAIAADGSGGGFQEQMKGLDWEFAVINSPVVNAAVVPGGKVVVYTGLLDFLKNEDELAAVLSHEVGHVVARHSSERVSRNFVATFLAYAAYWVLGIAVPGEIILLGFTLPNSRFQEHEADEIGVQLAARACFKPEAAMTVFGRLHDYETQRGRGDVPKFMLTHPVSADRVERIKSVLPQAERYRDEAGCDPVILFHRDFEDMFRSAATSREWKEMKESLTRLKGKTSHMSM